MLRVMAAAPKERLSEDEFLLAWRELMGLDALTALRQYLDGLVAEYSDGVTDDRLWVHPALAAGAAARYDVALRIRSDLEGFLEAVEKREGDLKKREARDG